MFPINEKVGFEDAKLVTINRFNRTRQGQHNIAYQYPHSISVQINPHKRPKLIGAVGGRTNKTEPDHIKANAEEPRAADHNATLRGRLPAGWVDSCGAPLAGQLHGACGAPTVGRAGGSTGGRRRCRAAQRQLVAHSAGPDALSPQPLHHVTTEVLSADRGEARS